MDKTTYSYCEKLFYTIKVSEVTGQPAIIHLRDETGKGSSAIPINISDFENPVPYPPYLYRLPDTCFCFFSNKSKIH